MPSPSPSPSSTWTPPPPAAPAVVRVLTNATLLKTITSCQTGIPEELWRFINQRFPDGYRNCTSALSCALAEHGSLRLVQLATLAMWYAKPSYGWSPSVEKWPLQRMDLKWLGNHAIQFNRPDIVQWILETGRSWFGKYFFTNLSSAIYYYQPGDTRILDLLAAHDMLGCRHGTLEPEIATQHRCIDAFTDMTLSRWIDEHVPEIKVSSSAMDDAAGRGDLEVLRYLHKHRIQDWTWKAYEDAWANGHREVWWFLVENGPKALPFSVMKAVIWTAGRRFMRRLRRAQIKVDPMFMETAVRSGNSKVVGLLRDQLGMPVPGYALVAAAADGHIGVFGCLYKQMALDNADTLKAAMNAAVSCWQLQIVKFFHSKSLDAFTKKTMDQAARMGHLDIVKFLHENRTEGCTVDAMNWAAAHGHLPVVEFLHQHRSEGCTTDAMDYAVERNHLDVVQFLHENRAEGCTAGAMDHPGSSEILRYLLDNRSQRSTVAVVRWVHRTHWRLIA